MLQPSLTCVTTIPYTGMVVTVSETVLKSILQPVHIFIKPLKYHVSVDDRLKFII